MSYEQQCYTWPAIVLLCAAIALVLLGPSAPLGTQQKPGAGEYASRAAGKPGEESKAASNDIVGRLEAHGSSLVEKAVRALEECSERQAEDIDRLSLTSPPVGRVMAFAGEWSPRRADGNQWTEQELSWLLCDGWEWDHPTLSPLSEELKLLKAVLRDATALPDLVGCFLRGVDRRTDGSSSGRDKDPNRSVLSVQGYSTARPVQPFVLSEQPAFDPSNGLFNRLLRYSGTDTVHEVTDNNGNTGSDPELHHSVLIRSGPTHSHAISGGDLETRPVNVAVYWIIKFK